MAQRTGFSAAQRAKIMLEKNILMGNTMKDEESRRFEYFKENDEILKNDPVVGKIFLRLLSILFADGISFRIDGDWKVPKDNMRSIIQAHWKPFLSKMLRFVMCNGFLVWFISHSESGVMYPDVPDLSQINLIPSIKKNGSFFHEAAWALESNKSRLYVLDRKNVFGLSNEFQFSMINLVKPLLSMLYKRDQANILMANRAGNPPCIYQNISRRGYGGQMSDISKPYMSNGINNTTDSMNMAVVDAQFVDEANYMRVADMQDYLDTKPFNQGKAIMGPVERLNLALHSRFESNLVLVPYDLEYVAPPNASNDLDYVNTRNKLVNEIKSIAGFKENEDELTEEMFTLYANMFSDYLADIFNVIHNQESIRISDTKQTYQEENRRLIKDEIDMKEVMKDMKKSNSEPNVEIFLTSHVKKDIRLAKSQLDQNFMSEEEFYMLFPESDRRDFTDSLKARLTMPGALIPKRKPSNNNKEVPKRRKIED